MATFSTKIMIIRHGEKPGVPVAADGIDFDGASDPESLTAAGWQRAHALVALFHPPNPAGIRKGLAVPDHLFAASEFCGDHSKRPVETITPLAESFDPPLAIDSSIAATDIGKIADAVKGAGKSVLVCWKHEDILAIAEKLAPSETLPKRWHGSRFDIVWVFDLDGNGDYRFSQVPELVMATDQSTLMS
jgi:hypothetical protein